MAKQHKTSSITLSERNLTLFKALIQHFISDGQAVGSRTLARDSNLDLSPATIRNTMADLEDLGLLQSLHTSSGRVPTVKGYRFFVDTLLRVNKIQMKDARHIAKQLKSEHSILELMEKTSGMLSDITKLAGVVMLPRLEQHILKQVEFITLSDNRVLVILILNDGEIQNKIIHTARKYSHSELQECSNYLNSMYSGKDFSVVREELLDELKKMKDDVNKIMQTAIEVTSRAFAQDNIHKQDFVLAGQTNLMGFDELCDVEKLKKLFESFSQKRDLLHLLEQSINAKGVQIFIGEESGFDVLYNCSVVTSPYEAEGQILGVLGVIGPTRMNYEKVIPIVDITAKMLSSALNSLN